MCQTGWSRYGKHRSHNIQSAVPDTLLASPAVARCYRAGKDAVFAERIESSCWTVRLLFYSGVKTCDVLADRKQFGCS